MSAQGLCFFMASFSMAAFFKSLAGITNLTPLFANILAVSAPIPDVAPVKFSIIGIRKNYNEFKFYTSVLKKYLYN